MRATESTKMISDIVDAYLSMKKMNTLTESRAKKKGSVRVKGSKYNIGAEDKRSYVNSLAGVILEELEMAIKTTTNIRVDTSSLVDNLKRRMERVRIFPGETPGIISTSIKQADFSRSRIQWQIRPYNTEIRFTFHVTADSSVDNPEYGEVDDIKGKFEHYLQIDILGEDPSIGEPSISNFEIEWQEF